MFSHTKTQLCTYCSCIRGHARIRFPRTLSVGFSCHSLSITAAIRRICTVSPTPVLLAFCLFIIFIVPGLPTCQLLCLFNVWTSSQSLLNLYISFSHSIGVTGSRSRRRRRPGLSGRTREKGERDWAEQNNIISAKKIN
jgi:hypothetical protein